MTSVFPLRAIAMAIAAIIAGASSSRATANAPAIYNLGTLGGKASG